MLGVMCRVGRRRWVAGAALLATVTLGGAPGADAQDRLAVTRWTAADGLPQTSVTSIARDGRGFLWITTFGGLVRFDGRELVRADLPGADREGDRFTAVAAAGDQVWIGSERGRVFRLDVSGKDAPVEIPLDLGGESTIWQLLPVDGRVVVAAGTRGAWELDGDRARPLEATPRDTRVVVRADDGAVWAAGYDHVRCLAAGCAPIPIAQPSALAARGGVLRVIANAGRFTVQDGHAIADAGPPRLTADELARDGWQLAQVAGVTVTLDGAAAPLAGIRAALVDDDGSLWLGSNREGLVRVRDRASAAVALPSPQGSAAALALPMPDGSVLAAGYCNGLYRLPPAVAGPTTPAIVGGPPSCVTALAIDPAGGAWIGATGDRAELWHLDATGAAAPTAIDGALPGDVKVILARHDGGLWLGTADGLLRVERAGAGLRVDRRWTTADGLPHAGIYALTADPSGLLIGTAGGAARLTGDTIAPLIRDGDRRATVRDIAVRGGVAWLTTYGDGLVRVDLAGPRAGLARWRGVAEGFCSDHLSRIIDAGGRAWINANQGVLVVPWDDLDALFDRGARPACDRHDTGEGNGGGAVAGGVLPDGRLVFPGEFGVTVLSPEPPRRAAVPATFVETAMVDGRALALDGRTAIPPGRRDLIVKLDTPLFDLAGGEAPRFQVAVIRDGHEVHREVTGTDVSFLGLPPGDYALHIQRIAARGVGPEAVLRFRLARAWWETTAARIGLPIAVVLIVGVVIWLWVGTLRARARALQAELDEHARAEAARRERDALYNTVFERSPGPLFLLAQGGAVRELNSAARRLLGCGDRAADLGLALDDDRARWSALLAAAARAPTSDELTVRTASGEARRVQMHAGAVEVDGVPLLLVAATDVTAEREAEARRASLQHQVADRERLEAIGRLAGGVAHDFNNVLAVFQVLVDEARGHVGDPRRMHASVAELQVAVRAGRDVATRFLGFGKDAGAPAALALDEVVPANRRLLERLLPPDASLTVDGGAAGARVSIVAGHVDRILLNLVVNASDALGGEPGDIVIRTRALAAASTGANVVLPPPAGPVVELTVEDTGCGMDEDTRRRAFEPFFSTKDAKGTGLGLSVVYNLVSAAGGGLAVDSAPGRGSRFTIQLARVAAPAPIAPPAPRPAGRSVMVCEDNQLVRTSLVHLFRHDGWSVLEAEDGAAALAALADRHVDLLVTDQHMPRLDGAGLIDALRAQGRTLPVIVVSGDPGDATARLGGRHADVRVVAKPFSIDELTSLAASLTAPS